MNTIPIIDTDLTEYEKHVGKIRTMAYNKGVKVMVFTEELRRLCKTHGYNFPGMWIQAAHETGDPITGEPFESDLWERNANPAGLKNASGGGYQRYYNGVDAARALVVHMSAYVRPPKVPNRLNNYRFLDTRYLVAVNANAANQKVFRTFHDLAGYWAEDRSYGDKHLAKYRKYFGG